MHQRLFRRFSALLCAGLLALTLLGGTVVRLPDTPTTVHLVMPQRHAEVVYYPSCCYDNGRCGSNSGACQGA